RGGGGPARSDYADDDDFAPPVGAGTRRTGKLGRVETPKDRAEARRAKRLSERGRPTRLDGSTGRAEDPESPAEAAAGEDLPAAVAGIRVGDTVLHDSYGTGTVVGLEGRGRSLTARVEFTIDGAPATKRLMLRYAPVTRAPQ
ncbi:ATP-dependent DNA helicase PcrA, partial [Actinomyces bowdenii]|nr:ATP-dependent DNA helicase PcrA [Actinomyces bowdenii]NYS69657.1 ATP-dependent DNA helicase PcrA [Actinomyces bowdenii]